MSGGTASLARVKSMINKLKTAVYGILNGKYGEFIRYSLVGVVTNAANFCIYFVLYKFLDVHTTISNCAAVIVANIYSYFGNKRHVFRTHCAGKKALFTEMSLFFTSRAGTIILELIGVPALIRLSGEPPMLAKIEIVAFVIILNYFVSKFIVFHVKRPDKSPKSAQDNDSKK